jgi:hypothetical protein
MSPFVRSFALAVSLPLFLQPPIAAEPSDEVGEGVLVLHNGQVLRGGITRVGDKFMVTLGENGELRIPVRDVQMHCRDLREVYLRKRLTLNETDVAGHLELADWCLRHSLLPQAADEVLAAIAVQPDHPQIYALERRLQLAVNRPLTTLRTERQKRPAVSLDELERTMRELPEDVVQTFTAHVQPLLVNRCASNACHGSGSDAEFRLVRPSWGKTLTRRFTQRNLYASLAQIDKESPEKSPLLTAPSAPHGNLASTVFGERDQQQFELLANWVQQLVHQEDPPPETIAPGPSSLLQASYAEPVSLPRTEDGSAPNDRLSGSKNTPTSGVKPGAGKRGDFVPRDPFDPEIFNRRFLRPDHQD